MYKNRRSFDAVWDDVLKRQRRCRNAVRQLYPSLSRGVGHLIVAAGNLKAKRLPAANFKPVNRPKSRAKAVGRPRVAQ